MVRNVFKAKANAKAKSDHTVVYTEWAKKVCPRLRDSACWRSGEITQPRTHFFGQLCTKFRSHKAWQSHSNQDAYQHNGGEAWCGTWKAISRHIVSQCPWFSDGVLAQDMNLRRRGDTKITTPAYKIAQPPQVLATRFTPEKQSTQEGSTILICNKTQCFRLSM